MDDRDEPAQRVGLADDIADMLADVYDLIGVAPEDTAGTPDEDRPEHP